MTPDVTEPAASRHRTRTGRWWWLPAAVCWAPLLGWPLLGDHLLTGWERPAGYGPFSVISGSVGEVAQYLQTGGNFRPLGRLVFDWMETVRWPIADLAGIGPHIILGVERIAAAGIVAFAAAAVARRLRIDAGWPRNGPDSGAGWAPLVAAACLVAAWPAHPAYTYPLFQVGLVAAWAVAAPLVVCGSRPDGWTVGPGRRWGDRRVWAAATLGMLAAVCYELLYATPLTVAAYVTIRTRLLGIPAAQLIRIPAVWRTAAYAVGTAAVAVPARVLIETGPVQWRYAGTDIVDAATVADAAAVWGWRAVVGVPISGWMLGVWSEAVRLWPAVVAAAVFAAASVWKLRPTAKMGQRVSNRAVWTQVYYGAALIFAAAAVGASSAEMWEQHTNRFLPAWRDTAVVQVGWTFVICAAFDHLNAGRRLVRLRTVTAALAAAAMLTATVSTHIAMSAVIRQSEVGAASAAISHLSVNYRSSAEHNRLRCAAAQMLKTALEDRPAQGDAERTLAAVDTVIRQRHGPEHGWCTTPAVRQVR